MQQFWVGLNLCKQSFTNFTDFLIIVENMTFYLELLGLNFHISNLSGSSKKYIRIVFIIIFPKRYGSKHYIFLVFNVNKVKIT